MAIPLAFLFLCSIAATAQATLPSWVQAFGSSGTGNNIGYSVKVGLDHNLYVTGQFSSTADFGGTRIASVGGLDIFVAKYSPSGALLWLAQAGGTRDDMGLGLDKDWDGNVYVTGRIQGNATFHSAAPNSNTVTVASTELAIFIAKYTSLGDLQWVQTGTINCSGCFNWGQAIAVNGATGSVYITGISQTDTTFSSADGTSHVVSGNGNWHTVLAKYDTSGIFQWGETNSASPNSAGEGITVDAADNAYVTGWFEDTCTWFSANGQDITLTGFSPAHSDNNYPDDTYLAKYDKNGNAMWVNHIGGYKANPNSVAVGPSGEVTLVGLIGNINYGSSGEAHTIATSQPPGANFDLGGGVFTNPYNTDEVIATYNSAGELIRALRRGGSDNESANGVAYDSRSDVYVTSAAQVNSQPQLFVDAYAGANLLWEANATIGQGSVSPALYVDVYGSVFVTGGYSGTATFGDIMLNGSGTSEVFVSQLQTPFSSQVNFISADNLTPFQPRSVGAVSDVKTVRLQLTYTRALTSIAIAPGFTEFQLGSVSGCVVDGQTVNPVFTACSVQVTFSPKYPGLRTAPLIVTDSNGSKSSIGLTGIGLAPQAALTPGIFHTAAGNGHAGFSGDGGPSTRASLNAPFDVATDAAGNIYFTDQKNYRIRKMDSSGIITTVAGIGLANFGGDGRLATSASIVPNGVALDAAGNLYIADAARIRKVDTNGIITTFAGTGDPNSPLGDGGPATEASLQCPNHLAIDAKGNVYISDACAQFVRKVDTNGIITTVAGTGTAGFGGDGGPAASALLNTPESITVDAASNLYIADSDNQRIRKVDTNDNITTVAGSGQQGFSGDGGLAVNAQLNQPNGVAVDAAGNIYIADTSNARIRRVDTNGMIITVAGSGSTTYNGDGISARSAGISPQSITVDSAGDLVIADFSNNRVRKVDVSQSAVGFTPQAVGSVSKLRRMVVTNTGNQHLDLGALNVTGDFNLLTGDSSFCSSTPNIGAGFSCALEFTFAPTAAGALTGSATVTDDSLNVPGTTQAISLSGTGTNP
jgi:sugar lactone lactonase YvrE